MWTNWVTDSKVTEFLMWPPHENIDVTKKVLLDWVNGYDRDNFYQWAIVLKTLDEPIGSISIVQQRDDIRMVHVGYCIGKKWWNQVQQYYVENAHPAIIEPAVFDMVQQEMQRRRSGENRHSGAGIFASRLKCGECGSWYGSKVWHSTSKYRRTIYQCNHKFNGEKKCGTPHLSEDEIKTAFVSAANIFLTGKEELIADFNAIKAKLFNVASLEKERARLQDELVVVSELIQKCIEENACVALDQSEYESRYTALAERYNTVNNQLADTHVDIETIRQQMERMKDTADLSD